MAEEAPQQPDAPQQPEPPKVDKEALAKILREARAPWQQDGGGVRGPNPRRTGAPPPGEIQGGRFPVEIKQAQDAPPFPEIQPSQTTEETEDPLDANANEYSFELQNFAPVGAKAINQDTGEVKIHVGYGEINGTPPDGMTGDDDYFLTITVDGTEIWAVITYDQDTLAITSRALDLGAVVPDSVAGTLYVPIGFVDIALDDSGKIKEVSPHNRQCGDINVAFIYGAFNGAPAIFFLSQFSDPVAVTL